MTAPDDDSLPAEVREALLQAMSPAFPAAARVQAIKQRLLARVAAEQPPASPDAAGLITMRADEGEWKAFLPKVSIKLLHREENTLSYLLRLEAGAVLLPHDHPQDEECVVLEGEARIGDLVVRAGDYHCAPRGKPHGAIHSEHGALLFLRGAVPAASQVRWLSLDTLSALAPVGLREFVDRW